MLPELLDEGNTDRQDDARSDGRASESMGMHLLEEIVDRPEPPASGT
jgi:hypothetical protein